MAVKVLVQSPLECLSSKAKLLHCKGRLLTLPRAFSDEILAYYCAELVEIKIGLVETLIKCGKCVVACQDAYSQHFIFFATEEWAQ